MFDSEGPDSQINLIDFGLALKYRNNEKITARVGTVTTMSPEVIRGEYSHKADIWSIGVIAYQLLSGKLPFNGKTRKDIAKAVVKGEYSFKDPKWKTVSKDAKNFIRKCLQVDPELRYTTEQALKSPWLAKITNVSVHDLHEEAMTAFGESIHMRHSENSELRMLASQVAARKAPISEIAAMKEVFHALDMDHDGLITMEELKRELGVRYGEKEIESWFQKFDVDETGTLNYTEFLAATIERRFGEREERIVEAFEVFDKDSSGFITPDNLREVVGTNDEDYVSKLIEEADTAKDGRISYAEFREFLRNEKAAAVADIRGTAN